MNVPKVSKKALRELKLLVKDFPDIASDVVKLMLESANGDVKQAKEHLQEMQLEVRRHKDVELDKSDGNNEDRSIAHRLAELSTAPSPVSTDEIVGEDFDSYGLPTFSIAQGKMKATLPDATEFSHRLVADFSDTYSSCPTEEDSGTADHLPPLSLVHSETELWEAAGDDAGEEKGWNSGQNEQRPAQWESSGPFPLQLTLDKDLAYQLIMSFGLMQVPINVNHGEDLKVELDRYAAYALYLAWRGTQEKYILPTANEEHFRDGKLAEALQDLEHETYVEGTIKQTGFSQIMDETLALGLMGRESEARGMGMNSVLKYQTESGLENKYVDVLLKAHNVADEAALTHTGNDVRHVYASNMTSRPGTFRPGQVTRSRLTVEAEPFVPTTIQLNVKPVAFAGTGSPSGRTGKEVDYYGPRQEALELQRQALQYGSRAGLAFRDKKLGGGAAAYYLQKSHETKALAKEAHLTASLDILSAQNLNASDGEVDLHGLRADEVSPALDLFFQRKHGQKKELKIISGVGRHSRSGSSEVRVRVAAYLRAHGFPFEEGPPEGVFYVQKWQKLMARPP